MGVKSLWQLLDPVGRPVLLETMEGKSMAIDSSIWIYQFQATMRDKEGRGLVNAHVLGFLRRICKLLFYGIKPVFVFDGGAPALKMSTIAERKKKKSGAAASHARVAERLLAAQLRREALDSATGKGSQGKGRVPSGIDENTVYLEDITGPGPGVQIPQTPARPVAPEQTPLSSSKKSRWRDHDPYKLPDINMDEVVAKATATAVPDPRLATEDELRTFIEEMRPEDFDVTSPAFRELPTEVQYEIIGDLRLKSRQTSYKRLQSMLRKAKTPLDFSKEQIKNLKQRNALTQQLLVTTDSIGKSHLTIPIRIASERNKEYVLVKNEGIDGGWVLGIRDEGTALKPIEIDPTPETVDSDEDEDMEDVPISYSVSNTTASEPYDPDFREYRRQQALSALADRLSPKKLTTPKTRVSSRKPHTRPLFEPENEELVQLDLDEGTDDPELARAIQESMDLEEEVSLRRAIEESRRNASGIVKNGESSGSGSRPAPEPRRSQQFHSVSDDSDGDEVFASPTRLETALSIAGAVSRRPPPSKSGGASMFGAPNLLLPQLSATEPPTSIPAESDDDDDMEPVVTHPSQPAPDAWATNSIATSRPSSVLRDTRPEDVAAQSIPIAIESDSDEEMEQVEVPVSAHPRPLPSGLTTGILLANLVSDPSEVAPITQHISSVTTNATPDYVTQSPKLVPLPAHIVPNSSSSGETLASVVVESAASPPHSDAEPDQIPWSRSPSPSADPSSHKKAPEESWDAAQEMDPNAEEDEYTRFLSQVKGKDVDTIRREIDEEIRELNKQKKNAMRDSEDITQQMVSQIMIMLRLFGIPYMTAPMEAEAQCATLLSLGLVDGIITDDSDVFLFGGGRVLKNMFNQSKTVECYLATDLERELGLDRDKLVRLAYLLGSDYTEGLPGVGPVVAMELLSEFSGHDGLHKFKQWWIKVQNGRDRPEESASTFKKRFKKKFKDLYLAPEWPNPAVRDAYYHPTADESTEPFKWGLPDLDALRGFFNSELGWGQEKVDELLLPIIRKMNKRSQSASTNAQGSLSGFFDIPLGANAAPRKRQAYTSKRLQQVVSDFRKQQARQDNPTTPEDVDGDESGAEEARPAAKKRKKSEETKSKAKGRGKGKKATVETEPGLAAATRGNKGMGRKRGAKRTSRKRQRSLSESEDEFVAEDGPTAAEVPVPNREELGLRPRPRPRPVVKPQVADVDSPDD